MKYFTKELLNYDYANKKERYEHDVKWGEAVNSYYRYFDKFIRDKLSKNFISLYFKSDGFHDSLITGINIENTGKCKCNIKIVLEINSKSYALIYKNVSYYNFHVPKLDNWIFGIMSWSYDELELLQDGQLNQKILCDENCEFDIVCKKIYIKQA
jgi:hypothetical protein